MLVNTSKALLGVVCTRNIVMSSMVYIYNHVSMLFVFTAHTDYMVGLKC